MYKSRFTNIFRSFLISYIVILIIPNVAGYTSYKAAIDVAETGSIDTSLMVFNQSKDILERRMDEVEAFTTKITMNQDLKRLLSESANEGELSRFMICAKYGRIYMHMDLRMIFYRTFTSI